MTIAIASGKGGTGKTTLAVNLAVALATSAGDRCAQARSARSGARVQLLDCDVEAPNAHLFLKPQFAKSYAVSVEKPSLDPSRCTGCGLCAKACRHNAIAVVNETPMIFEDLCRACGLCSYVCPAGAIADEPVEVGTVRIADDGRLRLVQGTARIRQLFSPTVVSAVKDHLDPKTINIIDAPPGTTCPVVKSVKGSDAALLVTEPTPFGLHDLILAAGLSARLGVPTGIVINQSDGRDSLIEDYAEQAGFPIVGRIPFRRDYAEAYSNGSLLVDLFPEFREAILGIYDNLSLLSPPEPSRTAQYAIEGGLPAGTECAAGEMAPEDEGPRTFTPWELVVISGKGGTGKTTLTAALSQLAGHLTLADTDVDASNLHLILQHEIRETHEFEGESRSTIDASICTGCGACAEVCRSDAVAADGPPNGTTPTTYRIEALDCEGCGFCSLVCVAGAISETGHKSGRWFASETPGGPLVHACLDIAESNSGRLVTLVRKRASELAVALQRSAVPGRAQAILPSGDAVREVILTDGPPGAGCPVAASVTGATLVLIVTEPTVSGAHDMKKTLELCASFDLPSVVVINKADLNPLQAGQIELIAAMAGSRVIGRIPFDGCVNQALAAGKTVVEFDRGPAAVAIEEIWETLQRLIPAP